MRWTLPARIALVTFVAVIAAPRPAAADHKADEAEARELYQKAIAHYDLAEYDRAIEEFKRAYELTNKPELLFNLAQAHRARHDWSSALHFYRTYLAHKPQAPNRADVEALIAEAEREEAAAPTKPPVEGTEKPPDKPAVVQPPPGDATPPKIETARVTVIAPPPARVSFWRTGRGRAALGLSIGGAALLITSATTGGLAVSTRGAYDSGCAHAMCDDSLFVRGRGLAIATDVLISVGVVAVATAAVLLLVRPRARPVEPGLRF